MDDSYHFGCQFTADLIAMNTAGEYAHAVHDVCTCRPAQVPAMSQRSAITRKPVRATSLLHAFFQGSVCLCENCIPTNMAGKL